MTLKRKKITIRDVALTAGVSYQTVSRVINASQSVAEPTRKRILQTMHELGYTPNKIAQALTTNKSLTLELLFVDVQQGGQLAESIKSMADTARSAGYDLLVATTTADELGEALENAASRLIDGVIMHAPYLRIADDTLQALCHGMPLVRRDYVPTSQLAWVGFDQKYATQRAVEYLIGHGHRRIAAILPSANLINGYYRYMAWHQTLLDHGLVPGPMCEASYAMQSAYDAMRAILSSQQPFTAFIVGTDMMALGTLRALHEHGLRVPEDISIVSFNNAELSAFTEPPLTTMAFKFEQQDAMAVKCLIDMLHDPETKPDQHVLLAELVVRNSVQACNSDVEV